VDLLTIICCSVDIGGLADHIVCSVDIGGLADHHCLFC
jgi:hypothetical protein